MLLSVRDSPETWWASADPTVLEVARRDELPEYGDWLAMFKELLTRRLTDRWNDPPSAMAAYERHNERIRSTIHAARLLVWSPDQGWEPICRGLGLPVPNEPFPHVNKREEW